MNEQQTSDPKLTRETLWLQCANFARNVLDPDVDMRTLNEVTVKVYEAMEFLVRPEGKLAALSTGETK